MTAAPVNLNGSARRLGEYGPQAFRLGLGVGGAALVVSLLVGFLVGENAERFFRSYLIAFLFVLTISLGGLFFVMLQHVTRAGWSVVVRRLAEGLASNLLWIWVLFLPVLVGLFTGNLYAHWADPALHDEVIAHKAPYFFFTIPVEGETAIPWFWLLRAALFFSLWALLAWFYVGRSVAQDASGDVALTRRLEWWAPLGLITYALTQSFAAFDWLMSLEPVWFSTIFPVYFFAASCCGFFALLILCMYVLQRGGRLGEITLEHYHDVGKALFAFGIVFWAYIAYSQYMLQWYANIPETSGWFITRQLGGWAGVSALLLVGHFAGPFLILISRHTKRAKGLLAGVAGWMLFMHFIDIYWLGMPTIPASELYTATSYAQFAADMTNEHLGYGWHLLDLTCVLALLGLLVAGTAWRLSTCALLPERDPRLRESLAFENL